jgi:multidrug efflux pump subunit AcrA (membrane-fusion protein)
MRTFMPLFRSRSFAFSPALHRTPAIVALLIGLGIVAPVRAQEGTGPIVKVAKAQKAWFTDTVRVNGFIVPRADAVVLLEMDGYRVSEVLVRDGDQVTSGQQLLRLSRMSDGAAAPGPPGAGPQVASAGGAGGAGAMPATMVVRAPAAGTIVRSNATAGAVASPQAGPVFVIAIDGEMDLDAEVLSIHVPKLAVGQVARVEIEQGRDIIGRVRRVAGEIGKQSQLGHVRIAVDRGLRMGTFARASIDTRRSEGIAVPRAAVVNRADGTTVQVVRGGIVETRKVRLGLLSARDAEITEGVNEGELVVAFAGTSLRDGDKVRADIIGQGSN